MNVEHAVCDCCHSDEQVALFSMPDLRMRVFDPEYTVQHCTSCGHRYLSPRPCQSELAALYPPAYYSNREPSHSRQTSRYAKQISYLPSSRGNLLDIGCAGGGFLQVAAQVGWNCYGCDFQRATDLPPEIPFQEGDLPALDYSNDFFDAVTAWGVFEHLYTPSAYFETVARILKPQGVFVLLVPHGGSLWSRWAYKEDVPRHVQFFTPASMKRYLERTGFRLERMDFPARHYTRPATGKGMFRTRAMRLAGATWPQVLAGGEGLAQRLAGLAGGGLDALLIHPRLEEFCKLSGNMLVVARRIE